MYFLCADADAAGIGFLVHFFIIVLELYLIGYYRMGNGIFAIFLGY